MNNRIHTLTQHFYDATSPECSRDSAAFKPAIAFEVAHNIHGIAGRWQFPGGQSATAYENWVCGLAGMRFYIMPSKDDLSIRRLTKPTPLDMDVFHESWGRLVDLNPGLAVITPRSDEPLDFHDALCGAAALFNAADIKLFLEKRQASGRWDTAQDYWADPVYQDLLQDIQARGGEPRWMAAPETLRTILQKIDARGPASPAPQIP